MTFTEFFNNEKEMAIHCLTQEEANRVCAVFDELGKKWRKGESPKNDTRWDKYKANTIYFNNPYEVEFGTTNNNNYGVKILHLEDFDEFKSEYKATRTFLCTKCGKEICADDMLIYRGDICCKDCIAELIEDGDEDDVYIKANENS